MSKTIITGVLIFILTSLIFLNLSHRIYLNIFTGSLPSGIYIRVDENPQRGLYAVSCLEPAIAKYGMERGYLEEGACHSGSVPVLKIIKGIPGDSFSIMTGKLCLNGHLYEIHKVDSRGRMLQVFYPPGKQIISDGKYFLLSTFVDNSWDSRYWGPVAISCVVRPLLTLQKLPA